MIDIVEMNEHAAHTLPVAREDLFALVDERLSSEPRRISESGHISRIGSCPDAQVCLLLNMKYVGLIPPAF
jgi:hypothetical protein